MIDENYYPSDEWDIFEHLPNVSKRTFNQHFAEARRLQAMMALSSGHLEWRNWRGIGHKFMTMIRGKANGDRANFRGRQEAGASRQ